MTRVVSFSFSRFLCLTLCALSACTPAPAPTDASDASASDAQDSAQDDSAIEASVDSGPTQVAFTRVPRSREVQPGVIRESFTVDAPAPPPNMGGTRPETPTPSSYNRVQVIRYRAATTGEVRPQAVIVAMPGFLGGAGSFDPLARSIVLRGSAANVPTEVWAIDRRSNLLEDLRGMEAAEALNDPEVASRYYFERSVALEGQVFSDFIHPNSPSIAYMSEWGLATTINDLHAVISSIPSSKEHVVLLGHSLGASIAEAYAGWDFQGTPGYSTIAGTVLIDGVLSGRATDEQSYLNGGMVMGLPSAGLNATRASGPYYFALPILGLKAVVMSEVVARRARKDPRGVIADAERDRIFRLLLTTTPPRMTNAGAFGLSFDNTSCPLGFARMSLGAPSGGPLRMVNNPFTLGGPAEMISIPADPTLTYDWTDATATTPLEFTSVANGINAWAATPTNFSEWYFPARLPLDISVIGNLNFTQSSWQWREGLFASHGGEIDVPVLAVATSFLGTVRAFDSLTTRLSTSVGAGRPAAGASRNDPRGLRIIDMTSSMTHIDPLTAVDDMAQPTPRNPVPEAVFSFARSNTTGTILLPPRT